MEKGQIVEVVIEDMSYEGQGIGRADGMVVFVPDAVVGDRVRAQLTKVKKNYSFSRLVEILVPSSSRDESFDCEYFKKGCGGCSLGGIEYGAQLKLKQSQVYEKIQRLAEIEDPYIRPIIGMDGEDNDGMGQFRYRNKAQFPVSTGGIITRKGGIVENLGEPAVGFFRAKSHDVVNCEDCYLQSMAAMAAADALRTFMEEDNITAYDPKWDKGLIRHLIVKTAMTTGEVMVILVINGKGIPNVQKLIEMLDEAVYEVGYSLESVVLNIKKSAGVKKARSEREQMNAMNGEIMGDENIIIAGKPVIRDVVGEMEFEISPASFYQVNPVQMRRLYDRVRDYCFGRIAQDASLDGMGSSNGTRPIILDLYCGVGTIGLYCAKGAEFIVGIEAVKEAVVDANRNAVINGIVNARYIAGKAEDILPEYVAFKGGSSSGPSSESPSAIHDIIESDNKIEKTRKAGIDSQIADLVKKANIAILDPPRAGCRPELLEAVALTGVDRIVYVSCDPATLARDIKILAEKGFAFVEATPVDMFPNTSHVECVVLLSREK